MEQAWEGSSGIQFDVQNLLSLIFLLAYQLIFSGTKNDTS